VDRGTGAITLQGYNTLLRAIETERKLDRWVRTSDLCRAKAERWFAGGFWSLQNSCKCTYLVYEAILNSSGDLPGLLHGCCTVNDAVKHIFVKADNSHYASSPTN
jgi:hypothetical protein